MPSIVFDRPGSCAHVNTRLCLSSPSRSSVPPLSLPLLRGDAIQFPQNLSSGALRLCLGCNFDDDTAACARVEDREGHS